MIGLILLTHYTIVLLSLILAVGAINIYYFVDHYFLEENRHEIYNLWTSVLLAIIIHSIAHLIELLTAMDRLYHILELLSLIIACIAMLTLSRDAFTIYAFKKTRKDLEKRLTERSKELETLNNELLKEIKDRKTIEENLQDHIKELEKWQKLNVGREQKISELKETVKELKKKLKDQQQF